MPASKPLAFTALALLIASAAGYTVYQKTHGDAGDSTAATSDSAAAGSDAFETAVPISVEGARVVKDTLVIYITASGESEAFRQASLTAEASGRIAALHVQENDLVQAGDVVMSLDTADFAFALQQAKIGLRDAQARLKDLTLTDDLFKMDPAVKASRDSAARMKSGLEAAQIRLLEAQMAYERSRLKAPFAGRIADLQLSVGARVGAGTEIVKLMSTDPIRVTVNVLEANVGLLAANRTARVTFSAYPGETFTGIVESYNPIVEQQSRTARVSIRLPNPSGRILPGMYARAHIEARKFPNRILVPRSAILTKPSGETVFVLNEQTGRTEMRSVTTGLGNDDVVEIVTTPGAKTLEAGEIVLTGGHHTLAPNILVKLADKPIGSTIKP